MRGGVGRRGAWAALAALASAGCATTFDASTTAGAVGASNRFGFDLYARAAPRENVICSPAGAAFALTMASAGARGETEVQMARVLHLDPRGLAAAHTSFGSLLAVLNYRDGKEGVVLSVADALWGQQDLRFHADFLALLDDRYRAPLTKLDFEHESEPARLTINQWASDRTRGRIVDLLPAGVIGPQTRLVITNAVYFKGKWRQPFDAGLTSEGDFITPHGAVPAKLMRQEGRFAYARVNDAQMLELPYAGGLSMVVVLPDHASGLAAVESRIAGRYDRAVAALEPELVDVKLPRWKTTSTMMLADALAEMGMPLAFDKRRADLRGIADVVGEPLYIEQVLQKAFIETNETGTEAAAVTAVVSWQDIVYVPRPKPIRFHADHPFLYLIRDTTTGAVLFVGRVVDPT